MSSTRHRCPECKGSVEIYRDPDPEFMGDAHCGNCGWFGYDDDIEDDIPENASDAAPRCRHCGHLATRIFVTSSSQEFPICGSAQCLRDEHSLDAHGETKQLRGGE